MQPYFWPYLGYFQLIDAVDLFVIYDNIQYTKKGWINRNRYLSDGQAKYFTAAVKKDSDYLDVKNRKISDSFDREKLKRQIRASYVRSPYFASVYPLFCECVDYKEKNLFTYIYYSVQKIAGYLGIKTKIVVSSTLDIEQGLKGKDRVLAICEKFQASEYINPVGGQGLYDKKEFQDHGIQLSFLQMNKDICYKQFRNEFVPGLSVLDVLMFNSPEVLNELLGKYQLI